PLALHDALPLIHNGYKTSRYLDGIAQLHEMGFENCIPILDNKGELDQLLDRVDGPLKVGLRVAMEQEPQSAYYTSRLGLRPSEVIKYYKERIHRKKRVNLVMLHFFVDTGIRDTLYYWGEF